MRLTGRPGGARWLSRRLCISAGHACCAPPAAAADWGRGRLAAVPRVGRGGGWWEGGGGGGGREGAALHCTMCAAPRCIVLRTALHCVCCAALHGARCTARCCAVLYTALCVLCYTAQCGAPLCTVRDVLYCTVRVALLRSERGAPQCTCVLCPSALCVLGCATAHCARRAAQHCACGAALPRSRLVRASRGGRGTRDRQLASVASGARTPGRERDT